MSSPPVISQLRGLGRRIRAISLFDGVAVVVAAGAAAMLLILLADYVLNLPPAGRVAILIIAAVMIIAIAIWRLARPLAQKIPLSFLATRVEQAFPQFRDRLRSTVDFTNESVPGSEAMKNRVVAETSELFQQIDVRRAVSLRPFYQSLGVALVAVLAILILIVCSSSAYRQIAWERLIHPFASPAWPKTVQIDLLDNLPRRVPVGQNVSIHMKLTRGDRLSRRALLYYQLDGGAVQQELMTRQADGSYIASLDTRLDASNTGNLKAWITAGDDTVHLSPVAIVPRLAIQSLIAEITPPAYTQLPATTADLSQSPVTATIGSRLTLDIRFNKLLGSAAPTLEPIDGPAPSVVWHRSNSNDSIIQCSDASILSSLRFHIHAVDADGFSNAGAEEYQIIARADEPPIVQIENPRRNEERTPDAVIPLQISAADDFAVRAVNLKITHASATPTAKRWDLPLLTNSIPGSNLTWTKTESSPDQQRYRLDWSWSLADLHLSPGDTIEYHALAQDNFDLNGQRHAPVASGSLRITIVSQQQFADHIAEQMRQIAQSVAQTRIEQSRTTQETQTLAHDTAQKSKLDQADRAILNRLTDQQGAHAAQTKQLADQLAQLVQQLQENRSPNDDLKQSATDAGNLLNQTAESPMKQSAAALSQMRDSSASSPQRNQQLAQTLSRQNQAEDQLQKALDRLGSAGSLDQTIEQVAALLKSQQDISKQTAAVAQNNLGKTPQQMSPADQQRLAANAGDQKALAQRTAEQIARMAAQAKAMANTDPDTASALSNAASSADQQQISPSQQRASDSISQNKQDDAQAAQQQAELGLQTILSGLHEAQQQKLAELSRHLADLQAQLSRLVRRQASHNLDNLILQNRPPDKLLISLTGNGTSASGEPRRAVPLNNKPTLDQLTTAQEQTHRNTRDIATAADQLKGVAQVAGLLVQSADKMERASVLLQQNQLPAAFDPVQTDALSLLLSAQKKLAVIKADLDQKLADASRQNLRQAYIKIKANQQGLNDQTQVIAQSSHLPDGSLNRINAIHLLQLPPQQQQLAQQVEKLDDRLASLGGIVYLWANKDIRDAMSDSANRLSQKQIGPDTQDQQQKIVAELDAMIQSLAVEPKQNEFAQRQGAGAGGGGGKSNEKPRLPSEAELRLMKQLEIALKNQTITAANLKNGSGASGSGELGRTVPPNLPALAQRQSQLRSLLDQLLQKASQGQVKLPPEPKNQDMLPEEKAGNDNDLANQLLTEQPADHSDNDDQSIPMLGNRMARTSQRLGINHDPGQTTQAIEQNILKGLDQLIAQARNQQAQSSPQNQQQQEQQQNPQIAQNPQQSQQSSQSPAHANSPARSSNVNGSAQTQTDLSQDIRQNMRQWGGLSDRQRQAILEGANDTVIEKYKTLVDDYYRDLAEKK
ncbi:MAG TPA: DUF4175 family protein [Tepidisphaeraceae bacterium]|jgi:hypothetical protein